MSPGSEAFAPAKVNLFLHITGRRPDGFHELDSLVVFADVGDRLSVGPAPALSLALDGPFASQLAEETDNIVLRAARALAAAAGRRPDVELTLRKMLPVASGIGGGSADAAACLRLLSMMWSCEPDPHIALALGADVPVCLESRPVRMAGIGELILPAPALPLCGLLLVNPGVPVATAAVFRARAGGFSSPAALPARWDSAADMAADLGRTHNDLEPAAQAICPQIADVLGALRGLPDCLLARMSGSGGTCFGLFVSPDAAARAAPRIARPGWWSWGGALASDYPGAQ